jgi:NAD(P)-dependent dehydrogenase (short-subunit alcohol dehydrogenase family)
MSAGAPQAAPAIQGRFTGKVVLVTGATGGIGAATARRLAAEDATLVLTGRNRDAAETLLADLENASFVAGDVRERTTADRLVASALERHGRLDVLVNNAAIDHTGAVLETPIEEVRALFDVNVFGAIHMLQAAGCSMRARGGAIVNVTSRLASIGVPTMAMYSAPKARC